jgi:hypothetical protein
MSVPFALDSLSLNAQLSLTGYTNEFILRLMHTHNPQFVEALGSNKVKSVSLLFN